MIRKKGKKDPSINDGYEADAQAAGLEHWSANPGYIPDALDNNHHDSLGPSWQTGEEEWDDFINDDADPISEFSQIDEQAEYYPARRVDPVNNSSTNGYLANSNTRVNKANTVANPSPRRAVDPYSKPSETNRKAASPNNEVARTQKRAAAQQQLTPEQIESKKKLIAQRKAAAQRVQNNRTQKDVREDIRGNDDPRVLRARQIEKQRAIANRVKNQTSPALERDMAEDYPDDQQLLRRPSTNTIDDSPKIAKKPSDRNLIQAAGVGILLLIVAVVAIFLSEYTAIALIGLISLFGVAELYQAMRGTGLKPAKLLGYVGTVSIPATAFFRGEAGYPLVLALIIVFGALWYLIGADNERPVLNISLTIFGMFWVGGLAGFAGLMIYADYELGRQLLMATIIITALSDTLAYFGGRAYGVNQFHPVSPNKTWEGTLTGFAAALGAGLVFGVLSDVLGVGENSLFDGNFTAAVVLGIAVGILAPIGDLTQSLVKRDLGVKDMGFILPGHGGILDRMDGLLFALPGAYYVAVLFELIPV